MTEAVCVAATHNPDWAIESLMSELQREDLEIREVNFWTAARKCPVTVMRGLLRLREKANCITRDVLIAAHDNPWGALDGETMEEYLLARSKNELYGEAVNQAVFDNEKSKHTNTKEKVWQHCLTIGHPVRTDNSRNFIEGTNTRDSFT